MRRYFVKGMEVPKEIYDAYYDANTEPKELKRRKR